MYYLLSSCWILLFLFSLFNHFPCASSKDGFGWCETIRYECGNITAGFPFWGGRRPETCGIGSLELRCNFKNMITSLNISNHVFNVLHINDTSNTLRLVRTDHLDSFCSSTFNSTTLPPGIFEILPTSKNLTIFYHCNPRFHYVSNYICPGGGVLSASENPIYQRFCQENFTVNVPIRFFPEKNELNLTHLESVLRKGFEVKVNTDEITCEECTSSIYEHYGSCSQSFPCGDQSSLLYPFWVRGREDCGHPDFKLDCSKGFPELDISDVRYRILEANYDSRIIRLARSDNITSLCPKNSLHEESTQNLFPFPQSVLQFAPQTEILTIYYDCLNLSSFNLPNVSLGEFHCELDGKGMTNYYVSRNASFLTLTLKENCGIKISIPVSGSSMKTMREDNLEKIIQQGFDLNVNQECSACMESKGACGYNQTSKGFVCYCNDGTYGNTCGSGKKIQGVSNKAIRIVLESVAGIVFLLVILTLFLYFLRKRKTRLRLLKLKALIPLDYYTYAQVKRITKSFAEVVGTGGFGIVYRGTLSDGRVVAVKVLKDSKGNGEDFINEVASMSKTSHVNIVALLGFCSEGSKRAIIYEFLENGSLDKFISGRISENMDWTALYRIGLGVAHGLEYLHHGCQTRIVHFDIKPQNVLLDENYCPKVSDFGLAKLCEKKESILSMLDTRGTIGYIAPEMISRVYGNVSHKSDVYSYGMLVLEMIGARNKEKAMQVFASNKSSIYFPEWVYRDLELGKSPRLIEEGVNSEEDELAKKMTLVGLWCIQISPQDRPPMNRVVEMMEGSLEALEVPPRPVFQIPTEPLQESFIFSEDTSAYTE